MSDDRKDLPPVNSPNFLEKVREAVQTYLGNRGATLDRGITLRDLTESGLVTLRANFGKGSSNPIGGPGSLIINNGGVYEPDLTPPPKPTGFAATAAISNLLVECDAQTYTQGHGHAKSRLYGATWTSGPLPLFTDAVVITEFSGTVASHATNPASTWHLWLTWVTVDGIESTDAAGGTNGVVTRTGEDVALLLEALTGEITASQLYSDLGSRIDLIDGPAGLAGSVAQRLASETSSRVAALVVEATNRTNAIQNEAGIRAQGILDEALARANGDSTLQSQVNLLTAASSGDLGDLISAVETEQTARIAGDAAEATARQTLATQFRGAYTGTDITQVTTGLVYSERTARTTADSAIASSVSTLSTTVANNLTTVNAAITAEATTRANADTAEATSRNTLQTKMIGAANPATATLASLTTGLVYDERSARSTADSTEVTARQLLSTKMVGAADPTGKTLANITSGLVFDERTARSTETTALATRSTALEASVNNATTGLATKASVTYVDTAKADAISTAASATQLVQAQLNTGGATQLAVAAAASAASAAQTTANTAVTNAATAQTAANTAQTTANTASTNATTANTALTNLASDNILSPVEKPSVIQDYAVITGEQAGIDAQATAYAITTEKTNYDAAVTALTTYLGTLSGWNTVPGADVVIVGTTFRSKFSDVYTKRQLLLNAIAAKAKVLADAAQTQANTATTNAATAQTAANTAQTQANTATTNAATAQTTANTAVTNAAAVATRTTALETSVNSGTTGLATKASVAYVDTAKADAISASATTTALVNARLNTGGDTYSAIAATNTAVATKSANFVQSTTPAATKVGDLWIDTANGNLLKRWSGSAWLAAEDTRIGSTASQVTTLQSTVQADVGMTRRLFWGFDAGIDGWSCGVSTASVANGTVTWAPTAANPYFFKSLVVADQFLGALATKVRANVRRISGSSVWEGNLYYSNANHGAAGSFYKKAVQPSDSSQWNVIEWDMSNLTAGGSDWVDNVVTVLRIDLVGVVGDVWEIDWVAVGESSVTPLTAAIQTEATTRATQTGDLYAQYTVKLDVGGKVSGYGLASSSTSSTFAIRADRFYIAPPSGSAVTTDIIPFAVQATATTINGVSVPAGVYINDAYIKNGTITNAKIGNAAIDDAKISDLSAAKITAGSIAVGQQIQSTGYVAGSAGWLINGDGTAEFSGVVVRGTVYATAGQIGGVTIASNAVRAGQTAYNTGTGFHLGSDGRLSLGNSGGNRLTWDGTNLSLTGALNAATGSFAGDISAATGTFAGNVHGGQFTTGAYTGYAWPAAGNYGTYVGPSGLLMGNANNGKYIQITQTGDIYTPGFNVVNGTMTVNQANVINTLNIAGNAVSTSVYASGTLAGSVSTTMYVPAGQTMHIIILGIISADATTTNMTAGVGLSGGAAKSYTIMLANGYTPATTICLKTSFYSNYGEYITLYCSTTVSTEHSVLALGTLR